MPIGEAADEGINWDKWFAESEALTPPVWSQHVTISVQYKGQVISVDMYVKWGDFDPTDPAQMKLAEIAADATFDAGATSFYVTSLSCCHSNNVADAHFVGMAMDISSLGGMVSIDKHPGLNAFEASLMENMPLGSQILGPDGFGVHVRAGGISPVDMEAINPDTGKTLRAEHATHIHIALPKGWSP